MTLTQNEHGRWEIRIKGPDGKFKSFSTHQTNKADAQRVIKEAKVRELEMASQAGLLTPEVVSVLMTGRRLSIEEGIAPWVEWLKTQGHSAMTVHNMEMWIHAWARDQELTKRQVSSITEKDIAPWINGNTPSKAGTRAVMLSVLRSFFKFASARGWMMGNPADLVSVRMDNLLHVQKEVKKQPCFTDEEIRSLITETGSNLERPGYFFWNAAVPIGRWTGLRLGDIACLEWACLSTPGKIAVWTQKRDKRVELPLDPAELAKAIDSIERWDPEFIFPRARDLILDPKRRSGLTVQFKRLCERVGIEGKSFHGLRSTYITECVKAGIPMPHIAVAVGHSSTATTEGYVRD